VPVSLFAKINLVSAALFLGLSGAAVADYAGAIKAAQVGDYVSALREFKELSKKGHPPSQYSIAVMYHFGRGQPRDFAEALKWYDLAVKKKHALELYGDAAPDHSLAKYNLGDMYSKGQGTEKDQRQGAIWFYKSAQDGFVKAQYKMGILYEGGIGVPEDLERAKAWFEVAAKKGHKRAKSALRRLNKNN